jgi:hypothetical protein
VSGSQPLAMSAGSGSEMSAYSPLFPFNMSPGQDRREQQNQAHDSARLAAGDVSPMSLTTDIVGASPLSQGLTLASGGGIEGGGQDRRHQLSRSINTGRLHAMHRTSIVPGELPSTDEYAKILFQSRTAKMHKWRSGSGSERGSPTPGSRDHSPAPAFGQFGSQGRQDDRDEEVKEADIADVDSDNLTRIASTHIGKAKDIEWVDWLDEYRKMKEAKKLADDDPEGGQDSEETEAGDRSTTEVPAAQKSISDPLGKSFTDLT